MGSKRGRIKAFEKNRLLKLLDYKYKNAKPSLPGTQRYHLVLKDGGISIQVINPTLIMAKKVIEKATNNHSC